MEKRILYHGSSEIVEKPLFGLGKVYNDYGRGFYCTEHRELAGEWSCTQGVSGYINQYEMEWDGLKVLNLSDSGYTILHWLTLLLENRGVRVSTPVARAGLAWLRENFHVETDAYDVMVGYRADDAYFSFVRSFLNNAITLEQLSYAMKLGKLGEQIVLKSREAFERIRFVSAEAVDTKVYFPRREDREKEARRAFEAELERAPLAGIFMQTILEQKMERDDARLR